MISLGLSLATGIVAVSFESFGAALVLFGIAGVRVESVSKMGPPCGLKSAKIPGSDLKNLRGFTPTAARLNAAVFSLGLAVRPDACLLMSA
jgi:hypothetical protein